jgi:hypothetical protein
MDTSLFEGAYRVVQFWPIVVISRGIGVTVHVGDLIALLAAVALAKLLLLLCLVSTLVSASCGTI